MKLPELAQLERVIAAAGAELDVRIECTVAHQGQDLPVYALALGNSSSDAPAVGFFGGVHGLERIGSRVVIAFLDSVVARLQWDPALHALLQLVRVVFMPLVNPGGAARSTRANPAGVDLMRNAPVDAEDGAPFLVGGQRISSGLPWYRGQPGAAMEPESRALCSMVERELHGRPFSLALDCHSGFGMRDRIWFPYAHRRAPMPHLAELHALHEIFRRSHAYHAYEFEPQSRHYLAHGDLWDHLHQRAMGSWLWVKKNPRQMLRRDGLFNPLIEHRERRVLRRHAPLLDFLLRAAAGSRRWLPAGAQRDAHHGLALARWYGP